MGKSGYKGYRFGLLLYERSVQLIT